METSHFLPDWLGRGGDIYLVRGMNGADPGGEEMINRDSHLLKSREIEQIGYTAWIDEDPVYIKAVNAYS